MTAFTYNADGKLTTSTDPLNHTDNFGFTFIGDGRLTSTQEPGNLITSYGYGPRENLNGVGSLRDPIERIELILFSG